MFFSLAVFALAALLAALQFAPFVGDVLTYLGTAYLVGLLINLGFLALAFEGLSGRAPRGALPLALLYFAGYYVFAGLGHIQANRFAATLRSFNHGKTVAYHPASAELVLRQSVDDQTHASSLSARRLVVGYGLDRVLDIARDSSGERYRAVWIEKRECPSRTSEGVRVNHLFAGVPGTRRYRGICLFSSATSLAADPVTVSTDAIAFSGGLICQFERQAITVQAVDGRSVELAAGRARPLSWIPWPVIGREMVGTSFAVPAFRFAQERADTTRAVVDPLTTVARALGLRPHDLEQRFGKHRR